MLRQRCRNHGYSEMTIIVNRLDSSSRHQYLTMPLAVPLMDTSKPQCILFPLGSRFGSRTRTVHAVHKDGPCMCNRAYPLHINNQIVFVYSVYMLVSQEMTKQPEHGRPENKAPSQQAAVRYIPVGKHQSQISNAVPKTSLLHQPLYIPNTDIQPGTHRSPKCKCLPSRDREILMCCCRPKFTPGGRSPPTSVYTR